MPPKPNYAFEKRQREQEKKKKKAEKALRKAAAPEGAPVMPPAVDDTPQEPVTNG